MTGHHGAMAGTSAELETGRSEPTPRKLPVTYASDCCGEFFEDEERRCCCYGCSGCLFLVGALLLTILLPLSLNSVEYNEWGLVRQRSTGEMHLDKGIYDPGRYALGPDFTFKKFRSDAHRVEFSGLEVFSADKLDSFLGINVIYFLNKSRLIELHDTYEKSYPDVVEGRIIEAIKNKAPSFGTSEFFQNRTQVEAELFETVRDNIRDVFVEARALYLARVRIPEDVRERQLKTAVQLEDNAKELNRQRAEVIRKETARLVNNITNTAKFVMAEAEANAALKIAEAEAEADRLRAISVADGLQFAYQVLNITTEEDKAAYDYIKTLERNARATVFLSEEGVPGIEVQAPQTP